jgi:glutamate-1-semialdehyde 2,1-aminomutase
MISQKKSDDLFARALQVIPGAVNSPVRAWKGVGKNPRFISRAAGPFLYDADGNQFIDYVCSYGPAILGHADRRVISAIADQAALGLGFGAPTELEIEIAEMIASAIKCAHKVRLVSSGTEAGMTAIRIARAATGRSKIIKFDGCYHGHSDSLLVRAGSGGMTLAQPDSAGVPNAIAELTCVARYNSIESVGRIFEAERGNIAAVIVEPIAANMGVVPPSENFLRDLADEARREGALLICDEVITGFRTCFGSAAEKMGIAPDLVMLGKIIGGGMSIGAIAGPERLMDLLAPVGPVYQAGTLSGNPVSVRAGLETLRILKDTNPYPTLEARARRLADGLRDAFAKSRISGCVTQVASLLTPFFGPMQVRNADEAMASDRAAYAKFFHAMIERGVNLAPSQFEAMFVSVAHDDAVIERTIDAARDAIESIANG